MHSSKWIEFKAEIHLPLFVQTSIHGKCNLAWRYDSARTFYVRAEAADEHYVVVEHKEGFEVLYKRIFYVFIDSK